MLLLYEAPWSGGRLKTSSFFYSVNEYLQWKDRILAPRNKYEHQVILRMMVMLDYIPYSSLLLSSRATIWLMSVLMHRMLDSIGTVVH